MNGALAHIGWTARNDELCSRYAAHKLSAFLGALVESGSDNNKHHKSMSDKIDINNLEHLNEQCSARKLKAPSAIKPEDRDYPVVVSVEFAEARENKPFFADIKAGVVWGPNQEPKPFVMRSNYNGDGAIALCVVDGDIVMVRQWRVPLGRYTWEVPRGFSETWDSGKETTKETLPKSLQTALREAGEEIGASSASITAHYLGQVAENSGTHLGSPAYWLLDLKNFKVEGNPALKVVSIEEAITMAEDGHTCSALVLLMRYLQSPSANK